jgi:tRNA modification GTPase
MATMSSELDPIVAIATPPGRGGIGIVRLSGRAAAPVMWAVCSVGLKPRLAHFGPFVGDDGTAIDHGIALFFPGPNSYTGEDVLELQAHGGPTVLQMLLERCLAAGEPAGLRLAEPGEFTRRAFLNGKLDLLQAEAVADLIEASTEAAVRSAQAALGGQFSAKVHALVAALIGLRTEIEATLDFPEEEIEFLQNSDALEKLARIQASLADLLDRTQQGALLREGLKIVLAGRPNVGKSSLLNALAEAEVAIVTPIAGTTRDRVVEAIQIEGVALQIVDTAGLRATEDPIERLGIERSWREIAEADIILQLRDASTGDRAEDLEIAASLPDRPPRRIVMNKVDLTDGASRVEGERIYLSARTGAGVELLRREILALAGWHPGGETVFLGRARHLEGLRDARAHVDCAVSHAGDSDSALELLAEELRLAQEDLARITGEFTSDDLLGEIFGHFCIGK